MHNPVRARRLVAGAAVPLLLTAATACGSSDEPAPAAADSPSTSVPDEAADEAGSGTQTQESKSDTPPPNDQEAPDGSGDQLTTASFLPALKEAVRGNSSFHITMDLQAAGQVLSAKGDARLETKDPAMAITMNGAVFGGSTVEIRLVDEILYLSLPPMTPAGKFVKIDLQDPNDPLAANMGDLTRQFDPLRTFDAFDAGLQQVKYLGQESISGVRLDRYRVEVDAAAAAQAQGTPVPPSLPETVSYDIWLDEQNLMRRIEFSLGQQVSMEMTTSQWGEPVTVAAPPPGRIAERPPQLAAPPSTG